MKKALVVIVAIIAVSCCPICKIETVELNEIAFDTLRVRVVIWDNDTLDGVSHIDLTKLNQ